MSSQMTDTVHYRGKQFHLVDAKGYNLFAPQQQGVRPSWDTPMTCLRGYLCTYELADGRLFLTEVTLYLGGRDKAKADRGEGPLLFGKVPHRYPETVFETGEDWTDTSQWVESSRMSSDFKVDGLREPIRFTGRLTLGTDFIREMYEHGLPHQAAYKYRTVYDVVLQAGRVTGDHDRTEEMAAYRACPADRKATNEVLAKKIKAWINRCFPWRRNDTRH